MTTSPTKGIAVVVLATLQTRTQVLAHGEVKACRRVMATTKMGAVGVHHATYLRTTRRAREIYQRTYRARWCHPLVVLGQICLRGLRMPRRQGDHLPHFTAGAKRCLHLVKALLNVGTESPAAAKLCAEAAAFPLRYRVVAV